MGETGNTTCNDDETDTTVVISEAQMEEISNLVLKAQINGFPKK